MIQNRDKQKQQEWFYTHKKNYHCDNKNFASRGNQMFFYEIGEGLRFKEPLVLPIRKIDRNLLNIIFIKDKIDVEIFETTKDALAESFKDEMIYLYNFYAREEDLNMTKNAQRIKIWLLNNIEAN